MRRPGGSRRRDGVCQARRRLHRPAGPERHAQIRPAAFEKIDGRLDGGAALQKQGQPALFDDRIRAGVAAADVLVQLAAFGLGELVVNHQDNLSPVRFAAHHSTPFTGSDSPGSRRPGMDRGAARPRAPVVGLRSPRASRSLWCAR